MQIESIFRYELQVEAAYQGAGYGKQLVALLEDRAVELKLPKLMLTVQSTNSLARQFYLNLGYLPYKNSQSF
jgi:GNAT superfamily N-acetyltransferase